MPLSWAVLLALIPAPAAGQQSGPSRLGRILVLHAASRVEPDRPERDLAPGSLVLASYNGLYDAGLLDRGEPFT